MTKKEFNLYANWRQSKDYDLFKVYKKPSNDKINSWKIIKKDMEKLNGNGLRITGHNLFSYSCAFLYKDKEIVKLRYYTAYNIYEIIMED